MVIDKVEQITVRYEFLLFVGLVLKVGLVGVKSYIGILLAFRSNCLFFLVFTSIFFFSIDLLIILIECKIKLLILLLWLTYRLDCVCVLGWYLERSDFFQNILILFWVAFMLDMLIGIKACSF